MSLLDFTRGPALQWSFYIFVFGVVWRVLGASLMVRSPDRSKPRASGSWGGARTVITRSFARYEFHKAVGYPVAAGYVWHLGLAIVVLLYIPHIEFIKGLTGLSWAGLPSDLILAISGVTVAVMVVLFVRRLTHPVLRAISNADDYISWLVCFLPLVTGFMAFAHLGLRYETLLGLHILSFEVFLVWFPFGKLMHAVFFIPSRAQNGAYFARRGVRA
jgi:nitrate reductase gamma subunit